VEEHLNHHTSQLCCGFQFNQLSFIMSDCPESQSGCNQKFQEDKLDVTILSARKTNGPNTFKDPLGDCIYKGNCTCSFSQSKTTVIDSNKPCESKSANKSPKKKECKKVEACKAKTNQKCEVSRPKLQEKKNCGQANQTFPSFEQYCRDIQSLCPKVTNFTSSKF
jgi:hypothetical protein